jgi:hypothetical protein
MVLSEVLIEMKSLKEKINQLVGYINRSASSNFSNTDKATIKLLDLLDKYRSHLILVNKINNEVVVSIGESELSLANAIIILKTIKSKIGILNSLIDKEDCILDITPLIDQRDNLLDEYIAISKEIKSQEWSISIDTENVG